MAKQVILTRKPQFKITETPEIDDRQTAINWAFEKLQDALRSTEIKQFFGNVHEAVMLFIDNDFYVPILEALTNYQDPVKA